MVAILMLIQLDPDDIKVIVQVYLDKIFINNVKVTEVTVDFDNETINVKVDKSPG